MREHFVCSTVPLSAWVLSLRSGPRRTEGLRSTSVGAGQTSPGRLAPPGPRAPRLAQKFVSIFFRQWIVYVAESGGKFRVSEQFSNRIKRYSV